MRRAPTLPTQDQIRARRNQFRLALNDALTDLAKAHQEYPDIDPDLISKVLASRGRGHGPIGVTRLAGMIRNIGRARPPINPEQVRREMFGPEAVRP